MNFSDKLYLIKTSLVLFTMSICVYIYENIPKEIYPQYESFGIGYLSLAFGFTLFFISLALARNPKTESPVSSENIDPSQEQDAIFNFQQEYYAFSLVTNAMINELKSSDDEQIQDKINKMKQSLKDDVVNFKSLFDTVVNSTEENEAKSLLIQFMNAYFGMVEQISNPELNTKDLMIKKLNSIGYNDKQCKVICLLLPKLQKKKDSFFELELSR